MQNKHQYLTKGKQIYVEGRLSSRTYQSGEIRHSLDINVQDVQFLGQRDSGGGQEQGPGNNEGSARDDLDDLPF